MENDKLLSRIAALLRKAEGTDNEYEAQAFMEAAQRIATAGSIDLAIARKYHDHKGPQLVQRTIIIGEKGTRGLKSYIKLFVAIALANDVHCDVLRDSTTLFAFGYDSDIEICQQLYQSLLVHMVSSCQRYLASEDHKSSQQVQVEYVYRYGIRRKLVTYKPVATITARLNFQNAYAERIGKILLSARANEVKSYRESSPDSQALVVLKDKAESVQQYYRASSTARGKWTAKPSTYAHSAREAGNAAAYQAKIFPRNQQHIGAAHRQLLNKNQ